MTKYINTAEIEKCTGVAIITYSDGNKKSKDVICVPKEDFDNMPTIGIVHCRECKHRREYTEYDRKHDEYVTYAYCTQKQRYHDDDWFCADGERRSDD